MKQLPCIKQHVLVQSFKTYLNKETQIRIYCKVYLGPLAWTETVIEQHVLLQCWPCIVIIVFKRYFEFENLPKNQNPTIEWSVVLCFELCNTLVKRKWYMCLSFSGWTLINKRHSQFAFFTFTNQHKNIISTKHVTTLYFHIHSKITVLKNTLLIL